MGAEKFFDIKTRYSGLTPQCAVIVATARALKTHGRLTNFTSKPDLPGGGPAVISGRPLPKPYVEEHLELLEAGIVNLSAHISNLKKFGVKVIVAVNRFATVSSTSAQS